MATPKFSMRLRHNGLIAMNGKLERSSGTVFAPIQRRRHSNGEKRLREPSAAKLIKSWAHMRKFKLWGLFVPVALLRGEIRTGLELLRILQRRALRHRYKKFLSLFNPIRIIEEPDYWFCLPRSNLEADHLRFSISTISRDGKKK